MNRLSKKDWILYTELPHNQMCCDVCDKVDKTIHFSILGNVYLLCTECVKELYDTINTNYIDESDCKYLDECQGRYKCHHPSNLKGKCEGACDNFEKNEKL